MVAKLTYRNHDARDLFQCIREPRRHLQKSGGGKIITCVAFGYRKQSWGGSSKTLNRSQSAFSRIVLLLLLLSLLFLFENLRFSTSVMSQAGVGALFISFLYTIHHWFSLVFETLGNRSSEPCSQAVRIYVRRSPVLPYFRYLWFILTRSRILE